MSSPNTSAAISVKGKWRLRALKWGAARLSIQAYILFCFFTVIGGGLTYPLVTLVFLGEWRFWRHLALAPRLYFFLLRCAYLIARGGTDGFIFSVPLFAPPISEPDMGLVRLNPNWPNGKSCGSCTWCCDVVRCPIVDRENGRCKGYNSLYWRYFNCGRFPTTDRQLRYYGCPKWQMR